MGSVSPMNKDPTRPMDSENKMWSSCHISINFCILIQNLHGSMFISYSC